MPEVEPLQPGDPHALGGFRLEGRVGEGAQGVVFLGSSGPGERVAVKLLYVRLGEGRNSAAKALAAAQKVDSFCTARILAADISGDLPYIVSEFIDGPSLRRTVDQEGPRKGDAVHRLAIHTATALTAIHQAGVVHRDLKPSNVLLGPDGPRVIDFGIARVLDSEASTTGGMLGSPAYMAPELMHRRDYAPAADVWAWAATMVFASCGRPPFGDESIPLVVTRIMQYEPDLGGLHGRLRSLVASCLDKDPARRPTSQQVLMRLLGENVPAVTIAPLGSPRPPAPAPVPRPATMPDPSATGPHAAIGAGIQVRLGARSSGTQPRVKPRRSRATAARRRVATRNIALLGGGATAAVALLIAGVLAWSGSGGSGSPPPIRTMTGTEATQRDTPKTGPPLTVTTATGDTYTVAAAAGGTDDAPRTPPPTGHAYASVDYVLSNALDRQVLLDLTNLPGDLFIRRSLVPVSEQPVCMTQAGVPGNMCTLSDTSRIIGYLAGSKPPVQQEGDLYMPPHASYLIRISTDSALSDQIRQQDVGLYVWRAYYITDQQAHHLPFP